MKLVSVRYGDEGGGHGSWHGGQHGGWQDDRHGGEHGGSLWTVHKVVNISVDMDEKVWWRVKMNKGGRQWMKMHSNGLKWFTQDDTDENE